MKTVIIAVAVCLIVFSAVAFVACKDPEGYQKISASEAKNIMDTQTGYIILDVRTQQEFAQGHIEGALLIPDYELQQKASDMLPDKDQLILVYCRSGNRSAKASKLLIELGYTNVKDFGGINSWSYGIVK